MKKSTILYLLAFMLVLVSACSKDDDNENDPGNGNGTNDPTFTGINKVNLTVDGTTTEFVFADEPVVGSDFSAFATKETEDGTVYTDIIVGAIDHFDQVSTAALIINFVGEGTGTHNISYNLADSLNLYNYTGSMLTLISDTATFPAIYFMEEATANITSYGDVGGYIEGTFESSVVSLAGVPQTNASISGNFKVMRFDDIN